MRANFIFFCVFTLSACAQSLSVLGPVVGTDQVGANSGLTLFSQGRISDAVAAWRTASPTNQSAIAMLRVFRLWDAIDAKDIQTDVLTSSLLPCVRKGNAGAQIIVGTVGLLEPTLRLPATTEELFRDAARTGHPFAPLGLAVLAERRSDRTLARKYLTDSIARSPTEVGYRAGLLYLSEIFVARDPAEGAHYVKESAVQGSWKAQQLMSILLTEGVGVERDLAEAARYARLAAENPLRGDSRNADAAIESIGPSPNPQ